MTGEHGASPRQSLADEAFAVTAEAFARMPGDWELAIQSAIAALFVFLASRPDQTTACFVEDGLGPTALARRDRTIDRFVELLRPGFATTSMPPPPVVAEAIGGGIYEVVRGHVLERRLEELPAAIPDATAVALSPFARVDRG
jgi:hypothetical protein